MLFHVPLPPHLPGTGTWGLPLGPGAGSDFPEAKEEGRLAEQSRGACERAVGAAEHNQRGQPGGRRECLHALSWGRTWKDWPADDRGPGTNASDHGADSGAFQALRLSTSSLQKPFDPAARLWVRAWVSDCVSLRGTPGSWQPCIWLGQHWVERGTSQCFPGTLAPSTLQNGLI